MKLKKLNLMLGASIAVLAMPVAAMAQDAAGAQQEVTSEVVSDAELVAAQNSDALLMQAQVESLQAQIDALKKTMTVAAPSWKGAPQWEDKEAGWKFKVRGRFMYDTAYITNPGAYDKVTANNPTGGNKNLGFSSRVRRIRLGVEGSIPGGFGYKAEADFANSTVGFGDVVMTYAPAGKPWSVTIGNQESLDGLEQMSSSRYSSFIERAAFNDAFADTRRLGIVLGLKNTANTLRADVGLFANHTIDASIDNDGWIGAARLVYAPMAFGGQLHFGANYQHREFASNSNGTASTSANSSSVNQVARYRARPLLQTTGERFVDSGDFAAKSDDIIGAEIVGIFKSLHVVAEGQIARVNAYKAGDKTTGLDAFVTNTSMLVPTDDVQYEGGYVEAGYFLTGETRGYKNGLFDRTKVLKPFDQGGWGAIQVNARFDYLNLNASELQNGCSNNFVTGVCTASKNLTRGGKQLGYLASIAWMPMDYVRFTLEYAHIDVTGGSKQRIANDLSSAQGGNTVIGIDKKSFGVDAVAMRAAFDF